MGAFEEEAPDAGFPGAEVRLSPDRHCTEGGASRGRGPRGGATLPASSGTSTVNGGLWVQGWHAGTGPSWVVLHQLCKLRGLLDDEDHQAVWSQACPSGAEGTPLQVPGRESSSSDKEC